MCYVGFFICCVGVFPSHQPRTLTLTHPQPPTHTHTRANVNAGPQIGGRELRGQRPRLLRHLPRRPRPARQGDTSYNISSTPHPPPPPPRPPTPPPHPLGRMCAWSPPLGRLRDRVDVRPHPPATGPSHLDTYTRQLNATRMSARSRRGPAQNNYSHLNYPNYKPPPRPTHTTSR